MNTTFELTILADSNSIIGDEFKTNGVSYFVEIENEIESVQFIFDTGYDGNQLLQNAKKIQKDISGIKHIILSHGHFDHTNGLSTIIKIIHQKPNLYCNENLLLKKILNRNKVDERNIGIAANNEIEFIKNSTNMNYLNGISEIFPGVWTITGIQKNIETKMISGNLANVERENPDGTFITDPIDEDTSILVEVNNEELFLIIGCGHSGIQNLIEYIKKQFPEKKIVGIIGGLQLHDKDIKYIKNVYSRIKELKLKYFCPIHSTGETANTYFQENMGSEYIIGGVGTNISVKKEI